MNGVRVLLQTQMHLSDARACDKQNHHFESGAIKTTQNIFQIREMVGGLVENTQSSVA